MYAMPRQVFNDIKEFLFFIKTSDCLKQIIIIKSF